MTNYPETFLRGLSADDWVSDGIVSSAAFQIKFEPQYLRGDQAAQSIGWEDDKSVMDSMLGQEKEGHFQFKVGLARFTRESIDRVVKSPAFRGVLSYEREPLDGKPYHGNLLISPKLTKTQRKLLPGAIATQFSEIILRP